MNTQQQTSRTAPHFAHPSLRIRVALTSAAVACSATVICAGLGLFEMQARSASAAQESVLMSGTPSNGHVAAIPRAARRG